MTLIVILIDGKVHCSFVGDVQQWRRERFFKVPLTPVRTKQLRIFSNSHSELDDVLALFCYDMENPTRRRIEDDMHTFQVEQYQKTRN